MYELDTLRHKARHGLEQLSLVILCSCTNKSQMTTTEQCQVAGGPFWDGATKPNCSDVKHWHIGTYDERRRDRPGNQSQFSAGGRRAACGCLETTRMYRRNRRNQRTVFPFLFPLTSRLCLRLNLPGGNPARGVAPCCSSDHLGPGGVGREARSSPHGVNNSRPSPAGARPGSTRPWNQRRSAVLISALATGPPAGVGGGLGPFLAA